MTRRTCRRRVVALAAGALVFASASGVSTARIESVSETGTLTYSWHGDLARGCAAEGLCDTRGEIVIEGTGDTQLNTFGNVTEVPPDATATIRVTSGNGSSCVDVAGVSTGIGIAPASGRLVATVSPPPSSGRCAGPLASDLDGIRLAVRRSAGRLPTFDLSGTRPFTAGPFTGRVVSTLVMRPSGFSSGGGNFFGGGSATGSLTARKQLVEYVNARYRLTATSGAIVTTFAGTSDPYCRFLDACGATGALRFSLNPGATLTLLGFRSVKRHASRSQALADFRRGRLGTFAELDVPGTTSETLDRLDGSSCRDSRITPKLNLYIEPQVGGAAGVTLNADSGSALDVMRTHCPGPIDADLYGQQLSTFFPEMARVGAGETSTGQLLAPVVQISLSDSGRFTGEGYGGMRRGVLGLTLTRTSLKAGTRKRSL